MGRRPLRPISRGRAPRERVAVDDRERTTAPVVGQPANGLARKLVLHVLSSDDGETITPGCNEQSRVSHRFILPFARGVRQAA